MRAPLVAAVRLQHAPHGLPLEQALEAALIRPWLRRRGGLTVGDNEPYRMDQVDHTITRHCFATRRPYVEIEVRQDLIADEAGVATWVDLIATMLAEA